MRAGKFALIKSGDDVDRRPLRCQHQVNADRARHLRQPRDRRFDVRPVQHHQVGQLVDDDDDVGQRPRLAAFFEQAGRARLEQLVVLIDVADALFRQHLQAALHLAHRVAQRVRRQLGLGDDGRVQMRNAFVVAQLQPLGIDQDQPHFFRRRLVQHRHDEGVDGDALARSGRAGDQQVRHGVQVGGDDAAVDVLAQRQRQLRLRAQKLLRLDHLAQPDGFALVIRHLDADSRLAGHALDQDALGAQRQAEIVAQAGDAAVLDAGFGLELEGGDHRAGIDLHHRAAHVELAALFLQHLRQVLQLLLVDGAVLVGAMQQRGRRQLVAAGQPRHGRLAVLRAVGARSDRNGSSAAPVLGGTVGMWRRSAGMCGVCRRSNMRSMPLRQHALDAAAHAVPIGARGTGARLRFWNRR